jgi:hypothetical protein
MIHEGARRFFEFGKNMTKIVSARDILLWELGSGIHYLHQTTADISGEDYDWEPLSPPEQITDRLMPPESKRVWRVFQKEVRWTYDYTLQNLDPPPFTTIA